MAEKIHNLEQTSAVFQVRGKVSGTQKNNFYKEGTTKNGGKWNSINFSIEFAPKQYAFIKLNGFPRPEVYYYKAAEKSGAKGETKKVTWANRMKSPGEGFRLIGCTIGLEKDNDGKNINKVFTEYDAVEYLRNMLTDGNSVFIKGTMEFRSYTNRNGEVVRSVELIPNQISLCTNDIDFEADNFKPMAAFENNLLFTEINKEMDDNNKPTGRFVVDGYSVGYNTIEPCEFIIDSEHAKLANSIKKHVKPFNSIKTYGIISVQNQIEEVEVEDDEWGDSHSVMEQRVFGPTIKEYLIVKADPSTIEDEKYSEDAVMEAIRKIQNAKNAENNFNAVADVTDNNDWGSEFDEEPWG